MSNLGVTRDSTSLMISESLGVSGMSIPCVTRDSTSLIISETLGAVWAVESVRHP
jgi:hypothetical protein